MTGWKSRIPSLLIVVLFALIVAGIWHGIQQEDTFTHDLRDGLVKACEQNGNPLREIVAQQLQDQIDQSQAFLKSGKYGEFFPNVPDDELNALIQQQNQRLTAEIDQLQPVDCGSLYP